ncbi:MAG: hypothetical protein LBE89_08070 [Helicobacteraceae bacterium]|jgi:hypothetical protein|nr:hypothetical protein [Helicobacteraceae bacterium]
MSGKSKVPYVITAVLLFMLVALMTLLLLSRYVFPVNVETQFMQTYQDVDKNYDSIVKDQELFFASYAAEIVTNRHSPEQIEVPHITSGVQRLDHAFTLGNNRFAVTLSDQSGLEVEDANVMAQVSRMGASDLEIALALAYNKSERRYETPIFVIENESRYKITVSISAPDGKRAYLEKIVYGR